MKLLANEVQLHEEWRDKTTDARLRETKTQKTMNKTKERKKKYFSLLCLQDKREQKLSGQTVHCTLKKKKKAFERIFLMLLYADAISAPLGTLQATCKNPIQSWSMSRE